MKLSLIISLITLSACGTFDLYTSAFSAFKDNLASSNKIVIDDKIKSLPYAMQIVDYYGKQSIIVLKKNANNRLSWVDSSNNEIITFNGKIIKTYGFQEDFEIHGSPNLEKVYTQLINSNLNITSSSFIKFSSPSTQFLEIDYSYSLISRGEMRNLISSRMEKYSLIKEEFNVPAINWKGSNFYWINGKGSTIKSKIILSPNDEKIHLRVFKSYKN